MTKHPHRSSILVILFCIISCLCWVTVRASAEASSTSSSHCSSSSALLDQLIQARCGPTGHAMWVYQGFLYDPVNGETIAPVQGLELIRRLPNSAVMSSSDNGALQIHRQDDDASPSKHQCTFLTRRLFLYQDPQQSSSSGSNNKGSLLLKSIRLRPNSPRRKIPMEQTVTVFDSATTFTAPPPSSARDSNNSNNNHRQEWNVHTEWPNGKTLSATAHLTFTPPPSLTTTTTSRSKSTTSADPTVVEYTIYARPGKQIKPPTFRNQSSMSDTTTTTGSTNTSNNKSVLPPRAALIQFGPLPQESNNYIFGARESYQYTFRSSSAAAATTTTTTTDTGQRMSRLWRWIPHNKNNRKNVNNNNNNDCRVRYTRYGEGPVWYGPGRYCSLELTGRRVHSYQDIPPTVAQVAAEYVPGFLSVHSPIQSTEQGQVALKWFRESNIQVMPPLDDNDDDDDSSEQDLFLGGLRQQRIRLKRWQSSWQKRVWHTAQRFRAATTFCSTLKEKGNDDT